jgi:hypothetical protein
LAGGEDNFCVGEIGAWTFWEGASCCDNNDLLPINLMRGMWDLAAGSSSSEGAVFAGGDEGFDVDFLVAAEVDPVVSILKSGIPTATYLEDETYGIGIECMHAYYIFGGRNKLFWEDTGNCSLDVNGNFICFHNNNNVIYCNLVSYIFHPFAYCPFSDTLS